MDPAILAQVSRAFMETVPHNQALGIRVVSLAEGEATMLLPYADQLIGNPETGVLHGGAISSLMDACCGAAVFMKLREYTPIATLDLRIDYLKPATRGLDVTAHAVCFKRTRSVAFVRCLAHHGDPEHAIASAAGAFMLGTRTAAPSKPGMDT
jgi:uncharacterized protein (TIGR00369 family)